MGIIINKPMENLTVESILTKLKIAPSPRDPQIKLDKPVFSGGPLAEDRGFILHSAQRTFASSIRISDNTVITTSRDVLESLGTAEQPEHVLVARATARGRRISWKASCWKTPGSLPRLTAIFCSIRR